MAQPYIGEVRMFAGSFAPQGWLLCEGQLLPISDNETLFQVIGTTYGGDGESTFALPDLRGRVPVHHGGGTFPGDRAGAEQVTLTAPQLPAHTHALGAKVTPGNQNAPGGNALAESPGGVKPYIQDAASVPMAPAAVSVVGGSQPHDNLQPYLCINFIVALSGIFPSPS